MIDYPIVAILIAIWLAYVASTAVAAMLGRADFPLPQHNSFRTLDGLRGYLAVSVIAHHFIIWLQITRLGGEWIAPTVPFFNQLGAGAVTLFFMTTGFLFYPRIETGWRGTHWLAFFIRRIFRLQPMILTSFLAVTLIVGLRLGAWPDRDFPFAMWQWLSTQDEPPLMGYADSRYVNAAVLWSLRFEWIFYLLVLPACAIARSLLPKPFPNWGIPLILLCLDLIRIAPENEARSYLALFYIGLLARAAQAYPKITGRLRHPLAGLAAVALLLATMQEFPTPYRGGLPAFGIFFLVVASGNSLGPVLHSRAAQVLGACSFGIYALHGILLSLIFTDTAGWVASLAMATLVMLLPIVTACVVIVAAVLHLIIERPGIALGARLAKAVESSSNKKPQSEV